MGLGLDDDLMLAVNRRHAGIALDDTFAGRHLGALVVSAMALADRTFHPTSILWMLGQPTANLCRVAVPPFDALDFLRPQSGLDRLLVFFAMARNHFPCCSFELGGLPREVCPRSTPALRRVVRQLHPINGEHLAADQALPIANRQDRSEYQRDVLAHAADEVGDGGEMRAAIAAQGDKGHLVAAGPFNATAADNALRIGKQHHLQQHRRRIGRGARRVVAKARIEARPIDLVIEQVIQCMLEGTRQQLPRQIDRQQSRTRINVLVAGHHCSPVRRCSYFDLDAHIRSA